MVEGHCAAGVAAALKHFPNQGSTVEDPHRLDSFSINDPDAWASFGALPYIETRAPLVMTVTSASRASTTALLPASPA